MLQVRALIAAALLVLIDCRTSQPLDSGGSVPAYAMTFEVARDGSVTPYSCFRRNRVLEPVSEGEIRSIMRRQRIDVPVREGFIAVRARDGSGRVIYRTMVKVVLISHTICCPHQDIPLERSAISVIVPAATSNVSFEGWQPATRKTFTMEQIEAASPRESKN